jgi:DNA-binding NarL/FixJ family response regulator
MHKKIRILLADDHPLIRAGFKSLLGMNEKFQIVAEAENGKELLELAARTQPDVVLTDISMPVMNGMEALEELARSFPNMRFIILTMHQEPEYILNTLKLGASGYLLKNIDRSELERAILTVYDGGKYFSPIITNILAESFTKPEPIEPGEVTPREKEVLELVARGNSTKQVADKLGISIRTVESHRINMLKKMKVNNTAELIKKAIELKILT